MPLTLQQKQSVVSEVAETAAQAHSVISINNIGHHKTAFRAASSKIRAMMSRPQEDDRH